MKAERCIIAFDPGLTGAIAIYFPSAPERVAVFDMPVMDGSANGAGIADIVRQFLPTDAVIETQGPRQHDGKRQAFKTGETYGVIRGVVAAMRVPCLCVTPQLWKKHFRLTGKDKEASRALALQRFPACSDAFSRKMDHGRAEAALIALWRAETNTTHSVSAMRGAAGGGSADRAAPIAAE